MTATQVTIIVSGETYKAREYIKGEGFIWDAAAKSWTCSMVPMVNRFNGAEGYAVGENYKGTLEEIRRSVACYAKSDKINISIGE